MFNIEKHDNLACLEDLKEKVLIIESEERH